MKQQTTNKMKKKIKRQINEKVTMIFCSVLSKIEVARKAEKPPKNVVF
jgi:hypothetical protein